MDIKEIVIAFAFALAFAALGAWGVAPDVPLF